MYVYSTDVNRVFESGVANLAAFYAINEQEVLDTIPFDTGERSRLD